MQPNVMDQIITDDYAIYHGDSVEVIKGIPENSVGLSVFSPPFPGMYVYSNSPRDIGNCANIEQLIEHFSFMMPDLLRITKPGRSCAVHLTQQVAFKGADGFMGLRDFRGKVIEKMQAAGWIYYGEVLIDKNPQVKAIRTKDSGLQFKSLATDSARMHMALGDYILQFKKPGENADPIRAGISEKYKNPNGRITAEEWTEWAAPVWYGEFRGIKGGIRETDVLNVVQARETDDERHLCPLQLGVIERCVKLWSAPGEIVFTPFLGVGSEAYEAVRLHRKAIGIELKESYFRSAARNLKSAVEARERQQAPLFAVSEAA